MLKASSHTLLGKSALAFHCPLNPKQPAGTFGWRLPPVHSDHFDGVKGERETVVDVLDAEDAAAIKRALPLLTKD